MKVGRVNVKFLLQTILPLPFVFKKKKKQDVLVKHEYPRNGHFLRNVTNISWYQQMHIDEICLHTKYEPC